MKLTESQKGYYRYKTELKGLFIICNYFLLKVQMKSR